MRLRTHLWHRQQRCVGEAISVTAVSGLLCRQHGFGRDFVLFSSRTLSFLARYFSRTSQPLSARNIKPTIILFVGDGSSSFFIIDFNIILLLLIAGEGHVLFLFFWGGFVLYISTCCRGASTASISLHSTQPVSPAQGIKTKDVQKSEHDNASEQVELTRASMSSGIYSYMHLNSSLSTNKDIEICPAYNIFFFSHSYELFAFASRRLAFTIVDLCVCFTHILFYLF